MRGRARAVAEERCGQSSVEYAVVLLGFLAVVVALAAVWAAARDGGLQGLVEGSASHLLSGEGSMGGVHDLVMF